MQTGKCEKDNVFYMQLTCEKHETDHTEDMGDMNQTSAINNCEGKLINIVYEQTRQNDCRISKTVQKSVKSSKHNVDKLQDLVPEIENNCRYKGVPGPVEDQAYKKVHENSVTQINKEIFAHVGDQSCEQLQEPESLSISENIVAPIYVGQSWKKDPKNSTTLNYVYDDEDDSRDQDTGSSNVRNYIDVLASFDGQRCEKVSKVSVSAQRNDRSILDNGDRSDNNTCSTISHECKTTKSKRTHAASCVLRRRNATCLALIKEDKEHFKQYEEFLRRNLISEEF